MLILLTGFLAKLPKRPSDAYYEIKQGI